ncbi:thermonuclease family protein [Zavarzinia sp.]|uniref:thermonuclease family protein n=1 Tax=Zavarzinia sp. TaxID=2027920 RepID=UPI0035660001
MKESRRESAFDIIRDADRIARNNRSSAAHGPRGFRRRRWRPYRRVRMLILAFAVALLVIVKFNQYGGVEGLLDGRIWHGLVGRFGPTETAADGTITGRAAVIDGDTLDFDGNRVRLLGVDAPETDQTCTNLDGLPYRCGDKATSVLSGLVDYRQVVCEPVERDQYDRIVALCRVEGTDIGSAMVQDGWALAYRHGSLRYTAEEDAARAEKIGLWQGEFQVPWDWRRANGHE